MENNHTQKLKINVPENPFLIGDGSDGIERDELSSKQNQMFMDYLKQNKYKNFGEWWEEEGKEELNSVYSESIISNKVITEDGSILGWWEKYLRDNLIKIIDELKFMQVWGDSITNSKGFFNPDLT
mgnify:CR=1 FL=1|tara:strand:- start:1096 stop:1473 length:378 start_codon:yes stop_codon:yes gene_type:complete